MAFFLRRFSSTRRLLYYQGVIRPLPENPALLPKTSVALKPEIQALKQKEAGPWKNLTNEEKVALYRATFTATYPEMRNVAGDGKSVFSGVMLSMGVALIFFYLLKEFVAPPTPITITPEWEAATREKLLRQKANPIQGISSREMPST